MTFTSVTVRESFPDFLAVDNRDQVERVMWHMPHILKKGAFLGAYKRQSKHSVLLHITKAIHTLCYAHFPNLPSSAWLGRRRGSLQS